jgi:hypothetical protein
VQVEEKRRAIAEAEAFKHPFKPQLATDIGRRSPSPSSSSSPHNNVEDPYFYAYASGSSNGGRVRRKSLSERTAEHVAKQQEKLFYGEVIEIRRRTNEREDSVRASVLAGLTAELSGRCFTISLFIARYFIIHFVLLLSLSSLPINRTCPIQTHLSLSPLRQCEPRLPRPKVEN